MLRWITLLVFALAPFAQGAGINYTFVNQAQIYSAGIWDGVNPPPPDLTQTHYFAQSGNNVLIGGVYDSWVSEPFPPGNDPTFMIQDGSLTIGPYSAYTSISTYYQSGILGFYGPIDSYVRVTTSVDSWFQFTGGTGLATLSYQVCVIAGDEGAGSLSLSVNGVTQYAFVGSSGFCLPSILDYEVDLSKRFHLVLFTDDIAYNIVQGGAAGSSYDLLDYRVTQNGQRLTNVELSEVAAPEPSQIAMMFTGFAALVGLGYRRRSKKQA